MKGVGNALARGASLGLLAGKTPRPELPCGTLEVHVLR